MREKKRKIVHDDTPYSIHSFSRSCHFKPNSPDDLTNRILSPGTHISSFAQDNCWNPLELTNCLRLAGVDEPWIFSLFSTFISLLFQQRTAILTVLQIPSPLVTPDPPC